MALPAPFPAHSPLSGPPMWGSSSSLGLAVAAPGLTTQCHQIPGASPVRPSPAPRFLSQHCASLSQHRSPGLGECTRSWGPHSCQQSPAGWDALQEGVQEHQAPQAASRPLSQGPHVHSEQTVGMGPKGSQNKTPVYFLGRGVQGLGSSHHSLVFTQGARGHHFQKSTFQKSSQQG